MPWSIIFNQTCVYTCPHRYEGSIGNYLHMYKYTYAYLLTADIHSLIHTSVCMYIHMQK